MRIEDVTIDAELEAFLPPLSSDERKTLKASVESDGFSDPIVVWLNKGVIVDGHNRYRIWQESGCDPDKAPDIVEKWFADKASVMQWMYTRQDGRRNWTAAQRATVVLKMKPAIEERAAERRVESGKATGRGKKKVSMNSSEPLDTRKELAAIAGVSEDTIRKTEEVIEHGSPEIVEQLKAGEISLNKAFNETKKPQVPTEEPAAEPEHAEQIESPHVVPFNDKPADKAIQSLRRHLDERLAARPGTDEFYRAAKAKLAEFKKALAEWRAG